MNIFMRGRKQGYEILIYQDVPSEEQLETADVVLAINPNNPTGYRVDVDELKQWHEVLASRNSWLVVDEAFMDCTPEYSLASYAPVENLVILRSVGKFFGLAGIRMGFVLAVPSVLKCLQEELGPWTVPGPSREICKAALSDMGWQHRNRQYLSVAGKRLKRILKPYFTDIRATHLFVTCMSDDAISIHERLCKNAILTRLLDEKNGIRFGLPDSGVSWERLECVLNNEL